MGLELELSSELAALRPIRVGAGSGAGATATATGPDDFDDRGDDAVMPEGSGGGATAPQGGGGEKDGGAAAAAAAAAEAGCVTPTSAASAVRPATACPPAPRKPRPTKRTKLCGCSRTRRLFPVPHDLATVFVPRDPVASSPPCPPAKKIRVHAVG
ncbi:hypothetical protein GUJ93_ZPchr0006g42796 [Zizania palustris]|uniref:Uncharacterized protein n=1 Tax=Zizania palustris TaxID=103762 RepID=A0A8J5SHW5_ZIZPA|nr:hypothetical protein GUJ93_ZPchr0006g42796 [Zizania palustris]